MLEILSARIFLNLLRDLDQDRLRLGENFVEVLLLLPFLLASLLFIFEALLCDADLCLAIYSWWSSKSLVYLLILVFICEGVELVC